MRIKICGITRVEDAVLAEECGAWAVGFIFAKDTPRYINPENVKKITGKISEKIEKAGVFVNSSTEEILKITDIAGLTKIQLHGEETPEFCNQISALSGKDVIKAFKIKERKEIESIENYSKVISYILLDAYSENQAGGTGKTFNWDYAENSHRFNLPVILAGGLTPENIETAYYKVKPFALDISSGVEKIKGIKSPEKLYTLKKIIQTNSENQNF